MTFRILVQQINFGFLAKSSVTRNVNSICNKKNPACFNISGFPSIAGDHKCNAIYIRNLGVRS